MMFMGYKNGGNFRRRCINVGQTPFHFHPGETGINKQGLVA